MAILLNFCTTTSTVYPHISAPGTRGQRYVDVIQMGTVLSC